MMSTVNFICVVLLALLVGAQPNEISSCEWEDFSFPRGEDWGVTPPDEKGEKEKACKARGGIFEAVPVYTDPMNYYTAGFRCCISSTSSSSSSRGSSVSKHACVSFGYGSMMKKTSGTCKVVDEKDCQTDGVVGGDKVLYKGKNCKDALALHDKERQRDYPVSYPDQGQGNSCDDSREYSVAFDAVWTKKSHKQAYVKEAHWSPMVVASHTKKGAMWSKGKKASKGVVVVAETGSPVLLMEELAKKKDKYDILDFAKADGPIDTGSGQQIIPVKVGKGANLVSVISMIAPSPDWFIGADSVSLCVNGQWVENKEVKLFAYDGGSDRGTKFKSKDKKEKKQKKIKAIKGKKNKKSQFSKYFKKKVPAFGMVTFKLMEMKMEAASSGESDESGEN